MKVSLKTHMNCLYHYYFKQTLFQVILIECLVLGLYFSPFGEPDFLLISWLIVMPTIYLLYALLIYFNEIRPIILEIEREETLQMKYQHMYSKFTERGGQRHVV